MVSGGGGGGLWVGTRGMEAAVCLSVRGENPPFAPRVWGGYWRSRLQLPAQMPAAPKIKCIKAGSRRLLSDHHDNRRMAWGDDTSTPILPRPREAALQDCSAGLFLRRLSLSFIFSRLSSSSSSLICLLGALEANSQCLVCFYARSFYILISLFSCCSASLPPSLPLPPVCFPTVPLSPVLCNGHTQLSRSQIS